MTFLLTALLACLSVPVHSQSTLVCLGDSLTAGYGLSEDQAYPALLEKKLRGWKVVNAGASGDTSLDALKRLDWILKSRPEAVFVALGANDGLRGIKPAQTKKNLNAIVVKIKAAGAKVFLAGMLLPTNYGAEYAAEFRAIYPEVAKKQSVPLMPFLLLGVGGVPRLNQADGIHPTPEGAAIIANNVYQFLKKRLPAPDSSSSNQQQQKIIRSRKDL